MIRVKVGGEWGVDGLGIVYIEVEDPRKVRLHVAGRPTYHVNVIKLK